MLVLFVEEIVSDLYGEVFLRGGVSLEQTSGIQLSGLKNEAMHELQNDHP